MGTRMNIEDIEKHFQERCDAFVAKHGRTPRNNENWINPNAIKVVDSTRDLTSFTDKDYDSAKIGSLANIMDKFIKRYKNDHYDSALFMVNNIDQSKLL